MEEPKFSMISDSVKCTKIPVKHSEYFIVQVDDELSLFIRNSIITNAVPVKFRKSIVKLHSNASRWVDASVHELYPEYTRLTHHIVPNEFNSIDSIVVNVLKQLDEAVVIAKTADFFYSTKEQGEKNEKE